jgi:hypothetical protein
MAEWKKVIVSGSSAHLSSLQVGSNQFIGTTQATTSLTGSFTGSFSGNGSGLSGLIPAAGTVTSSAQIVAHLAGTTIHSGSFFAGIPVVSGSSQITYSQLTSIPPNIVSSSAQLPAGIVSGSSQILAGTSIHSGSFFAGIAVVSSSAQVLNGSGVFSGSAQLPSGIVSGSSQVTGLTNSNLSGTAGITNANLANASVLLGSQTLTLGAAATTTLTGLSSVTSTTFVGALTGNASTATTAATVTGAAQTAITSVGTLSAVNVSGTASLGHVTVSGNATITGDLFVNGTTTQINTTELLVEDKFIILASGSAAASDGGIIIDRGSDAAGNIAFGFDADTDRWGYQNGLLDSTNAIVIGTNGNSAFAGYVFTQAAHTTKPTTGEFVQAGAIYTDNALDIWIYA